ncbi:MAG TPA: alpha/beta hydrolase-fold protein, partial [Acidimicrobiia bacterium]|nr:alpha/beta hydrolase-fold protein [Acidimicrobiia bacterium]
MSRKRLLEGLAAISVVASMGTYTAVMAGASSAGLSAAPSAGATTAGLSASTTSPTAAPAQPGSSGTVQILDLPSGDADGKSREVWVYRPDVPDSADLPVVYLLHGYPGNDLDVEQIHLADLLDQQFAAGAAPFVVVVPNGQSDIHPDTEWADSVDGEVRLETFIVSTAIPAVEGANRRDAAHRSIAGFSMGGYGSMNLAEHHPDLFGQVVSIAGYYHTDDPDGMGGASPVWDADNSPDQNIDTLAGTRTLLIADAEESDPLILGEAARFADLQRVAGQNPTLVVAPGNH